MSSVLSEIFLSSSLWWIFLSAAHSSSSLSASLLLPRAEYSSLSEDFTEHLPLTSLLHMSHTHTHLTALPIAQVCKLSIMDWLLKVKIISKLRECTVAAPKLSWIFGERSSYYRVSCVNKVQCRQLIGYWAIKPFSFQANMMGHVMTCPPPRHLPYFTLFHVLMKFHLHFWNFPQRFLAVHSEPGAPLDMFV